MRSPNPLFTHPLLNLLQKCKTITTFKQVHAQMIATGLTLHTYPLSKLLLKSSTFNIPYTLSIFNQIPNPTIFLFNIVISSLINHNKKNPQIAFSLYKTILFHTTVKPNSHTYPSLFKACCFHPWIPYGLILHTHVLKYLGFDYDRFVQAGLINYYSNSGKLGVARYLFDEMPEPDLPTWNSILGAYSRSTNNGDVCCGLSIEALCLFNEMLIRGNEITFVALISACANLGAFSQGVWAHVYILKNNLRLNCHLGTALVEMYSKCGCVELAFQVFDKMSQRDTLCYNSMIGGLAINGEGDGALELFRNMKHEGLNPDVVTFIVTICACSHVGLVEDGCEIFESIKAVYGIEPTLEHYGCIVDLLSRAGRIREAEEKIMNMPMKPNAVIWRSLLVAARVHGNLEIGDIALKQLENLEPETSGNYVLLSNMYASVNKWEDVEKVRKLMKDNGIIKMPGSSLVDVGGTMHEFIMGDKTHPFSNEVYLKLEEVNRRIQEYGHKPRTKEVLFDIEEEEKEDALSYHSEKLAIAFALLMEENSDFNGPIRIIKNLRICSDCHVSIKLISKVYERHIIVRDRIRFHHFKDGACSCLDFW